MSNSWNFARSLPATVLVSLGVKSWCVGYYSTLINRYAYFNILSNKGNRKINHYLSQYSLINKQYSYQVVSIPTTLETPFQVISNALSRQASCYGWVALLVGFDFLLTLKDVPSMKDVNSRLSLAGGFINFIGWYTTSCLS